MISHDIRNPLQSVLLSLHGFSAGVYGDCTAEGIDSLQRSARNTEHVIDLVNELIDFERSEEAKIILDKTAFDIAALAAEAIEQMKSTAEHLEVTIENSLISTMVTADQKRIARVLVNLISNALKHSAHKGVVRLTSETRSDVVEVRVTDSGPGIPRHLHAVIFDRYFQVSSSDAHTGSGLGLAICKVFVESHGCLIGIDSQNGNGSTFWFTLPLAPS